MITQTFTSLKSSFTEIPTAVSSVKDSVNSSKTKRIVPWKYRLIGTFLNFLSLINNEWAAIRLSNLWFTVFKKQPKPWVKKFWMQADRRFEVSLNDQEIAVYCWGKGPLIVLMHGWSGSGTQFKHFIPALTAAGFRVAVFDAPGHGSNQGKYSDLLLFSDSLVAIQNQIGPINTVVAHSFGAMATTLATRRGLMPGRMVLIAPHLLAQEIFDSYAGLLNLRNKLKQRFKALVGIKIDKTLQLENSWELLNTQFLLEDKEQSGLLIFDIHDEEVPLQHLTEIENHWTQAEVFKTQELGHVRLLKDKEVIKKVIDYLKR